MRNNEIKMTRGDYAAFHFHREDAEGKVILEKATAVYFTVKVSAQDETLAFQKTLDDMTFDENGEYHFAVEPTDTNGLGYGDYVYDLEVIASDNPKQTIAKGKFVLDWESTWASNEGEA